MPLLSPFRALRYPLDRIDDLSCVIAPPYDVISPQQQERLYAASPHNVVRLILGKQAATDTDADNRYTRARRDFDAWQQAGILQRDATPAFYLIEHTFRDKSQWSDRGDTPSDPAGGEGVEGPRTRLGFIALLQFSDPIERAVYRHEATLAAPKVDRTKLLEAIPASLEPIFCIYPDAGRVIQATLERLSAAAPIAEATMGDERVRMWAITVPAELEAIRARLATVAVLIADGHHRFEVAYAHRHRYPALMAYFVSMDDPGLMIRPIHRLVRLKDATVLGALHRVCETEPAGDLASLARWLNNGASANTGARFGFYDGRGLYRAVVAQEPLVRWLMSPPVPLPVAQLDVSVLHGLVLPQLEVSQVTYHADIQEALQAVARGEAHGAWLLKGIPLAQVYALASQGFTLPPKSTYFYPKVPSGLTMHLL